MLTMTLGTPDYAATTSGGVAIVWTLEDCPISTLVGRASTTPFITVTITDAGVYTVSADRAGRSSDSRTRKTS